MAIVITSARTNGATAHTPSQTARSRLFAIHRSASPTAANRIPRPAAPDTSASAWPTVSADGGCSHAMPAPCPVERIATVAAHGTAIATTSTAASGPCGSTFWRRCAMSTRCAGASRIPATACRPRPPRTTSRTAPTRDASPGPALVGGRALRQGQGEQECVATSLLRPLHHERAAREQHTARECDPAVEQLPPEHDHEPSREHRPEDRRSTQRQLRGTCSRGPRGHHRVVEEVVLVVGEPPARRPPGRLRRIRLVEPERWRSQRHKTQKERDRGSDRDIDGERRRPSQGALGRRDRD